jgi:O-antigen/teichoic acid export membrane protein
MKCSVASAGTNALLNFVLVPQFGMVGAATASAISFASIEVLMALRLWNKQNIHPFTPMYRKLSIICAIMVVSMLVAKDALLLSGTNWECAAFVIAYFVIIRYANVLDNTEIYIIIEIREYIRYNIDIRIPQTLKVLTS